jgi:DNA-binding transcriptional LysR family regulator
MEMQQIRHFVAVVQHGSFRRAAQELHITQPALTRSIRHLEERVCASLLTRSARGVAPTAAGAVFLDFARQTVNENARILGRLRQMQGVSPGELRIGVSASFSHPALARTLATLIATVPDRCITVWEEFLPALVPKVAQSELDMLITLVPEGFSHPDLAVAPLVSIPGRVLVSRDHPLARRPSVTVGELSAAKWIIAGLDEHVRFLERRFALHGAAPPQVAVRTNSTVLLKQLVLEMALVALVPAHLVDEELADGTMTALDTPLGDFRANGAVVFQKRLRGVLDVDGFVARFRAAYSQLVNAEPPPAAKRRSQTDTVQLRRGSAASLRPSTTRARAR